MEWLLFVVNFYIIFRFNQLFLQNFRQKNILSLVNVYKFLVLIYFQRITPPFFIRHPSNYLQVFAIFWKNLLVAKYQYNFTTAIEQYLYPSDSNTCRSLKFWKMTTKKPAAEATGFFILHGHVLVSQGATPNYIRR